MVKIAPSILSADFSRLGEQVREAAAGSADYIHVDVMDGHFVPNLTIGPLVVQAIRPISSVPLDVHLMIEAPDRYVDAFARAGADIITVHVEACPHLHRTLQAIRNARCRAGVALNPATSVAALDYVWPDIDLVLVMTVNPGFGGQKFIPATLAKIHEVRERRDAAGVAAEIEVDGGIGEETAPAVVKAGAEVLVAGSAVFNGREPVAAAIERIRRSLVRS